MEGTRLEEKYILAFLSKKKLLLRTLVVDWPLFLMLYKNKKTGRLVASS